jgi:hypothetical protein
MVELARRGGGLAQIWIDGYRRSPEEIELLF